MNLSERIIVTNLDDKRQTVFNTGIGDTLQDRINEQIADLPKDKFGIAHISVTRVDGTIEQRAFGQPYKHRNHLKSLGYCWDADRRVWYKIQF